MQTSGASRGEAADARLESTNALRSLWSEVTTHYRLRHSGMRRQAQASDAQLRIGESRDSGFDAEPVIGPRFARTRWHRPGMTTEGQRGRAMAGDSGKKLFVGPRFRRIRQQLGLSQTQIAEGLGISPSYINLIERNQRPVTAQMLMRLAQTYDLDLRDLASADEDRFFAELNEIFSDPLFRQIDLPKQELRDLAELCPGVTHSLQRLYAAYTEARRGETLVAAQMADRDEGTRFEANPIERVRDLIEANRNYFPELEAAAEILRDELNVPSEQLFAALGTRLRERHSIVTRVMPVDVMRETLRRFDRHRRQLLISELVDGPGRAFQLAFQTGLAECSTGF